jgi:endonuclease-8
MPEGDTIFRSARRLHRALAGKTVTVFDSVYPALMRVDHDTPLAGRTIEGVAARGKHLMVTFSGDLVLHTHMRMNGSWHVYRPGERWRAPRHDMRVRLATATIEAIAFNVPVAEFLTTEQLRRHELIQSLGPDLADPSFDPKDVRRRLATMADAELHDALLNQRVLAGIGNVLKSETLFVARVSPFIRVSQLTDEAFERLMSAARRLMAMNITDSTSIPRHGRATTGSLDQRANLFVYGRSGRACRRCGTAINVRKTGADARLTYWCPHCQPLPPAAAGTRSPEP